MWNKKSVYVLNYLKIFKAKHQNNPQILSPQENKKAVLTAAIYFKVSTLVQSQRQKPRFLYLRLPKRVFPV